MADFPFALVPDAPAPGGAAAEASAPTFEPFADTIGFGVLTPFRRGPSDFVAGGGVAFLQSAIGQVLGTAAMSDYTHGELPWRPEFGSLLHFLRHRPNNQTTAELARIYVAEALARWVPQVRLKNVEVDRRRGPNGELTILSVRIAYDIVGLSRPGNAVLVPDVSQTVTLSAAA